MTEVRRQDVGGPGHGSTELVISNAILFEKPSQKEKATTLGFVKRFAHLAGRIALLELAQRADRGGGKPNGSEAGPGIHNGLRRMRRTEDSGMCCSSLRNLISRSRQLQRQPMYRSDHSTRWELSRRCSTGK